jgi:hypothetical protein
MWQTEMKNEKMVGCYTAKSRWMCQVVQPVAGFVIVVGVATLATSVTFMTFKNV